MAPQSETEMTDLRSPDQPEAMGEAFAKGKLPEVDRRLAELFAKLELPPGSSIEFDEKEVKAKIKQEGAHLLTVHGLTLSEVAEQL